MMRSKASKVTNPFQPPLRSNGNSRNGRSKEASDDTAGLEVTDLRPWQVSELLDLYEQAVRSERSARESAAAVVAEQQQEVEAAFSEAAAAVDELARSRKRWRHRLSVAESACLAHSARADVTELCFRLELHSTEAMLRDVTPTQEATDEVRRWRVSIQVLCTDLRELEAMVNTAHEHRCLLEQAFAARTFQERRGARVMRASY